MTVSTVNCPHCLTALLIMSVIASLLFDISMDVHVFRRVVTSLTSLRGAFASLLNILLFRSFQRHHITAEAKQSHAIHHSTPCIPCLHCDHNSSMVPSIIGRAIASMKCLHTILEKMHSTKICITISSKHPQNIHLDGACHFLLVRLSVVKILF